MPSSQRHLGWKGPLEKHLQSNAIVKLDQLFPWPGQGPADMRFPKVCSVVCALVQRVCKTERKKPHEVS